MSEHCGECGSRLCGHGACPECNPCRQCNGGDRQDKYFGEDKHKSESDFNPGGGEW